MDKWDKFRKTLGTEAVDNLLATFGLGPKYKPTKEPTHQCPQCGKNNAVWKERHPDTDMNCMALVCPDCGYEKEEW